jgi:hypothetical protein
MLHNRVCDFPFTLTLEDGGYFPGIHKVRDHWEDTLLVLHLVSSIKHIFSPTLLDVFMKVASGALVGLVGIAVDSLLAMLLQASESVILATSVVLDFDIRIIEGIDDLGPLALQSL